MSKARAGLQLVVVAFTTSCVLAMTPVPDKWDKRTDPRCDAPPIYAVGDVLAALAFAGFLVAGLVSPPAQGGEAEFGLVTGGLTLVEAVSAVAGFKIASDCDAAQSAWDRHQIDLDAKVRASEQKAVVTVAPVITTPRGFFCAVSVDAEASSFCARDKAACTTARDAVVGSIPDLKECDLREAAWCFGERCAPARAACDAQRERTSGTDGVAPVCAETK